MPYLRVPMDAEASETIQRTLEPLEAAPIQWNACNNELTHYAVKLPFPLTPQFKAMLQSGVGTRDLDVRWVSSLSWYFLTLFGLQPVYNFILGSDNGKLGIVAEQYK